MTTEQAGTPDSQKAELSPKTRGKLREAVKNKTGEFFSPPSVAKIQEAQQAIDALSPELSSASLSPVDKQQGEARPISSETAYDQNAFKTASADEIRNASDIVMEALKSGTTGQLSGLAGYLSQMSLDELREAFRESMKGGEFERGSKLITLERLRTEWNNREVVNEQEQTDQTNMGLGEQATSPVSAETVKPIIEEAHPLNQNPASTIANADVNSQLAGKETTGHGNPLPSTDVTDQSVLKETAELHPSTVEVHPQPFEPLEPLEPRKKLSYILEDLKRYKEIKNIAQDGKIALEDVLLDGYPELGNGDAEALQQLQEQVAYDRTNIAADIQASGLKPDDPLVADFRESLSEEDWQDIEHKVYQGILDKATSHQAGDTDQKVVSSWVKHFEKQKTAGKFKVGKPVPEQTSDAAPVPPPAASTKPTTEGTVSESENESSDTPAEINDERAKEGLNSSLKLLKEFKEVRNIAKDGKIALEDVLLHGYPELGNGDTEALQRLQEEVDSARTGIATDIQASGLKPDDPLVADFRESLSEEDWQDIEHKVYQGILDKATSHQAGDTDQKVVSSWVKHFEKQKTAGKFGARKPNLQPKVTDDQTNESSAQAKTEINAGNLSNITAGATGEERVIQELNSTLEATDGRGLASQGEYRQVERWSRTKEQLKNIEEAAIEVGKRIDKIQVFGLHLTDFLGGMAVGWTSRNLAKAALIGLTGGASVPVAIAAGGITGAITGATREYIKQVRQNIKEAQVEPGLEQRRLKLKEKMRIRDKKALVVAIGKGTIMGSAGATVGTYVLENWDQLGSNLKHLAGEQWDNLKHFGSGNLTDQTSEQSLSGAKEDITSTSTSTATPAATYTPSPTETSIPSPTSPVTPVPTEATISLPSQETIPVTPSAEPPLSENTQPTEASTPNIPSADITNLLHQDIQIKPGSNFWQSFNVPQEYFPSGTQWINSANGVTQSDVIKDMVSKFAEANGHSLNTIPAGILSLNDLGLTGEQMEIIKAASQTTSVDDYRVRVMPIFQSALEKVSSK